MQTTSNQQTQILVGLAVLAMIALLVVVVVAGALLYATPTNVSPERWFSVGRVDQYRPGSITYFEEKHFFLVRLGDGDFLALYDLGSREQDLVQSGDQGMLGCRVAPRQDASFLQEGVTVPWQAGRARCGP